jgi:septal ring-binding cell division protein DamX
MALVLLLWLCTGVHAQSVQLQEEPGVSEMVRNWVANNRSNPKVEGWRVQIMASTDRRQVDDGRNRFRLGYPEVAATVIQEQPYYKLRVGAFRTRQEALAFIQTLEGWPGAYPAKDNNIHPRDFLEQ